nr:transcriptional regulator [Chelativorans sp. ZYF759]
MGAQARIARPGRKGINVNDNEESRVTLISGRVWKEKGGDSEGVHVMLVAPDDDSAVRLALEALAQEGYAEAELDQIGEMEGQPLEEPHQSAWQGAIEGDVSVVTFEEPV